MSTLYDIKLKDKTKWFYLLTFFNIFLNFFVVFLLNSETGKIDEMISKYSIYEQILIIGILAPALEEFIYRFPLIWRKKNIDFVFLITLPFVFYTAINPNIISNIDKLRVMIVFIFCYLILRKKIVIKIVDNFSKFFTYIFYGLSILFALSHLENYTDKSFIVASILIFLAFVSSIIFSFIRISIGFKYAVFSHILNNCFFITLNAVLN